MKLLLISGHGDGDSGACGNGYKEANLTREVTKLLKKKLAGYADVDIFDTAKNCYKFLKNGGKFDFTKYDFALEVHFNSASPMAHGTEVLYPRLSKAKKVDNAICANLEKLGYTNRGCKQRTDLLVINHIKNKGVSTSLIEVCFISNKDDIKRYQNNKDKVITAIANAFISVYELKPDNNTKPVSDDKATNNSGNKYYKKYTGSSTSLVDALIAVGSAADMATRKKIAKANGIKDYARTAAQNTSLLKLLKAGKLIKA